MRALETQEGNPGRKPQKHHIKMNLLGSLLEVGFPAAEAKAFFDKNKFDFLR